MLTEDEPPVFLEHLTGAPVEFRVFWVASSLVTTIVLTISLLHAAQILRVGTQVKRKEKLVFLPVMASAYFKICTFFPLAAVLSWCGLFIIRFALMFQLLLHLYEVGCLLWFWELMTDFLNGPEEARRVLLLSTSLTQEAVDEIVRATTNLLVVERSRQTCAYSGALRDLSPLQTPSTSTVAPQPEISANGRGYPAATAASQCRSCPNRPHANIKGDGSLTDIRNCTAQKLSDSAPIRNRMVSRHLSSECPLIYDFRAFPEPAEPFWSAPPPIETRPNGLDAAVVGHQRALAHEFRYSMIHGSTQDGTNLTASNKDTACIVYRERGQSSPPRTISPSSGMLFSNITWMANRPEGETVGKKLLESSLPECAESRVVSRITERADQVQLQHSSPTPEINKSLSRSGKWAEQALSNHLISMVTSPHVLWSCSAGGRNSERENSNCLSAGGDLSLEAAMVEWLEYLQCISLGPYRVLAAFPLCFVPFLRHVRSFQERDMWVSYLFVAQYGVCCVLAVLSRLLSPELALVFQVISLMSLAMAMYGLLLLFRATRRIVPAAECQLGLKFAAIKLLVLVIKGAEILLRFAGPYFIPSHGHPYSRGVMAQGWLFACINAASLPVTILVRRAYDPRDIWRRYSAYHVCRSGMLVELLRTLPRQKSAVQLAHPLTARCFCMGGEDSSNESGELGCALTFDGRRIEKENIANSDVALRIKACTPRASYNASLGIKSQN